MQLGGNWFNPAVGGTGGGRGWEGIEFEHIYLIPLHFRI